MAPEPMTASDDGTWSGSQIASRFVQNGPSARPGIGGVDASVPVVSAMRSASICVPSASSITVGTDQARLLEEDGDAGVLERRGSSSGLLVDDATGALADGQEVDLDGRDPHAEAAGVASGSGDLRAAQHDLRRDAAVVVALAAELVALGDGDLHARARAQLERDLGSGPTTPDHEDVEPLHRSQAPRNRTNTRA